MHQNYSNLIILMWMKSSYFF